MPCGFGREYVGRRRKGYFGWFWRAQEYQCLLVLFLRWLLMRPAGQNHSLPPVALKLLRGCRVALETEVDCTAHHVCPYILASVCAGSLLSSQNDRLSLKAVAFEIPLCPKHTVQKYSCKSWRSGLPPKGEGERMADMMGGRQTSSSASDISSGQWSVENGEFFVPFPVIQTKCRSF